MEKAVIYTRVSTEEQAKENHYSLDAQKRICTESASKEGLTIVEIFQDAGKSGTNIKGRPALREMLSYIEENKDITTVLVQDTDRIARNTEDHLAIKALLRRNGTKLLSVSQPGFDDTAEGKLIDTITASVNQFQSDITSRKVKKGMEQKAISGWLPGKAPCGYENTKKDEELILTLDPIRAPLIKKAFDLYASGGYSVEQINDILYDEGYRTKNGKKLQISRLSDALENPFYYGEFKWVGKIHKGNHEPLISKDTWLLVQDIRNSRTLKKNAERKHNFLLAGFIFCKCGRRFTAEHHDTNTGGKRYSYYHCTRGAKCHSSSNISLADLEKQVEECFKEVNFSDSFYDKLITELKNAFNDYQENVGQEVLVLQERQGAVKQQASRIEDLLIQGTISSEVYKKKASEYETEINKIELEIAKLRNKKKVDPEEFAKVVEYSRNICQNYKNGKFEVKRRYLGFFWEKFVVEGKQIIKATPTPLFKALQKLQKPSQNEKALVNTGTYEFINPPIWSG
ncbi:MAG: recombinase family protein [Patescibacteria group bacterium]